MRERGLVLEVHEQEAVVLTPAGEFRRVRLRSPLPQVGEEIFLPRPGRQPWLQWAAAAALLVAVSAAALGTWLPAREQAAGPAGEEAGIVVPYSPVVRWVTIDINPSVELGLDREDRVVSARGLNEDGARLLAGLSLSGKPAQEAVVEVAGRAVAEGYLAAAAPENNVLIAVTGDEEGKKGAALRDGLSKALQARQVKAEVESIQVDAALRESAARAGLSVGKYAIWLQATAEGLNVDPERLRRESLARAIREAGGNLGEVVGKAHQQQEFHRLEEKVKGRRPLNPSQPGQGGPGEPSRKQPGEKDREPEALEVAPPVTGPEEGSSPGKDKQRPRRGEDAILPRERDKGSPPDAARGAPPEQERNGERSDRERKR